MSLSQKLKNRLVVLSFIIYIFLWGLNISEQLSLRYFIIIPFLFSFIYKDYLSRTSLKIFNYSYFYYCSLFLVNYLNSSIYLSRDIYGIIFLCMIIYTFLVYRDLIKNNFVIILKIYFALLILFSLIFKGSIDPGSCNSSLFNLFPQLRYLNLSNGFFNENSHLAIMNIAALISSIYFYTQNKKDKLLLILAISGFLINLYNLSTTFILGYIICSVFFLFISKDKILNYTMIVGIILFSVFFYYNYDCNKKISLINIEIIKENHIEPKSNSGGLTSSIYERSILLSLRTLKNKPFGWGFDGSIKASNKFIDNSRVNQQYPKMLFWQLNLRDALGNIFKLIIEYGYLNLILIVLFIDYLKKNKLNGYQIFFISIFLVQLFRGVGYINGGFVLAFTEIFLTNFIFSNRRKKDYN